MLDGVLTNQIGIMNLRKRWEVITEGLRRSIVTMIKKVCPVLGQT